MSTLIDKVMGKQREREQARAADFQGIVREIAAGNEPDPDRVDGVLAEAEKTHTDVTLPLLAQMEDIEEQLQHLQDNQTSLQQAIADHRNQAESEQARAEQAKRIVHGEEQVKEHQRNAKWCERTANGCAAQLARVEKEIAKLERQQQSIREQMLVP